MRNRAPDLNHGNFAASIGCHYINVLSDIFASGDDHRRSNGRRERDYILGFSLPKDLIERSEPSWIERNSSWAVRLSEP